jgi:hypothetical protein
MAAIASVKLLDNESITCTPKYGSLNRNLSKSGDNHYYTLDTEDVGRINLNAHGAKVVQENWPGRGGVMKITKTTWDDWSAEIIEAANQIYPLEMKAWQGNGFETIPFVISGLPESPEVGPPAQEPTAEPVAPPAFDTNEWTLDDIAYLMMWATQRAGDCLETSQPEKEIGQGDYIGALERMAVSIFIEAKRQGLRATAPVLQSPGPAEATVQKVLKVFDGELVKKAPGLTEYVV